MSDAQQQELLKMTEWQVWGLGIKRGWTSDMMTKVIKWHRVNTKPNQLGLVKEFFDIK